MAMKVYLLDNGTLLLDQSFATWNHGQGIEFRFGLRLFVDHPDGKVMIDTGFDKAWVERKLPFEKPEQSEEQTIEAQFAKIGVKPEEIDIVINSHLHFDHCSNNKLFPQATFYFSKSELRHSYVPDPWERLGYDPDLVVMPGMKTELLDLGHYEYEVLPGITLIEPRAIPPGIFPSSCGLVATRHRWCSPSTWPTPGTTSRTRCSWGSTPIR